VKQERGRERERGRRERGKEGERERGREERGREGEREHNTQYYLFIFPDFAICSGDV
jgi:hypothetical protein